MQYMDRPSTIDDKHVKTNHVTKICDNFPEKIPLCHVNKENWMYVLDANVPE